MSYKVVLVTGASTGLGKKIGEYLAAKGFKVYGTSRTLKHDVDGVSMLKMDVTKKEEIETAVNIIIKIENRLDVLINNAGIGMAAPLEDSTSEDFWNVIQTNLVGPFETCKTVLPQMRKQKSGNIINVSSIASRFGLPYRSAYCASKSALDGLTEALRMEVKNFGIKVCSIQPGDIRTNINEHRIVNSKKGSVYKESFQRCTDIINHDVLNALKPDYFARKIYKILTSRRIKRTYIVGRPMQNITVFLKMILPTEWFEKIISTYYKI